MTGHGGYGGEVGHMVVNPQGRALRLRLARLLGDRDRRVRAAASRPAGRRRRRPGRGAAPWSTPPTGATSCAQAALRQVGDWLGFGVANLVNIFNPEMVIFGGTLRDIYLGAAAQVRSRLDATRCPPAASTCGCAPRRWATTPP